MANTPLDETKIKQLLTEGLPGAVVESQESDLPTGGKMTSFRVNFPHGRAKITFMPKGNEIYINDVTVDAEVNGRSFHKQGIGKKILANIAQVAEATNVKVLALQATDVGAYMWARAGFAPIRISQAILRAQIGARLEQLSLPEQDKHALTQLLNDPDSNFTWKIADSIYGFKLLEDQSYYARLDLENPTAKERFTAYTTLSKEQERTVAAKVEAAQENTR